LQAIGAGARLTDAERDTALLASAGRSNREIAEELRISVRTVESRLQSTYAKLGISRREHLKEALQ
jgi:DNA-binding CsgD family transcriptional regulator